MTWLYRLLVLAALFIVIISVVSPAFASMGDDVSGRGTPGTPGGVRDGSGTPVCSTGPGTCSSTSQYGCSNSQNSGMWGWPW